VGSSLKFTKLSLRFVAPVCSILSISPQKDSELGAELGTDLPSEFFEKRRELADAWNVAKGAAYWQSWSDDCVILF
jgi:hypothetical protein